MITDSKLLTLSNGMEFVRVPKGEFIMGYGDEKDPNSLFTRYDKHIVDIPYDYWMARYPVTNEQYNAHAKVDGISHAVSNWEKKKDHPVASVNWDSAMGYCKWLNDLLKNEFPSNMILRLPTEAEWEKAARGTDGRERPWGNTFDENKCNSREGRKGGTTTVGLYSPHGDSPYGCADMAGNVWEWTRSEFKPYPYKVDDGRERENEPTIVRRVLRGGSWHDTGSAACVTS